MNDLILPIIAAVVGSGGVASLITTLVQRRTSKQQQLIDGWAKDRQMFLEERIEDRRHRAVLDSKLDTTLAALTAERAYSTVLLQWGLAGAPPPPPTRQELVQHQESK